MVRSPACLLAVLRPLGEDQVLFQLGNPLLERRLLLGGCRWSGSSLSGLGSSGAQLRGCCLHLGELRLKGFLLCHRGVHG
jgi:hypothetical protein